MLARVSVLAFSLLLFCSVLGKAISAEKRYVPGIAIALEVRTPQGDLRAFQQPGSPPTYWRQDLPVVKGDKVTLSGLITTGGGELEKVRIRLDSGLLSDRVEPPWRAEVDTAGLAEGYHLVEVWASTKRPSSKENTATTSFLVVPQNDPLLHMLQPETPAAAPATIGDEERLACSIRSRDTAVDKELMAESPAKVDKPVLFFVAATPEAKEFFYTLEREGRVTYTSPKLPLLTHILLEPPTEEGKGQVAGELILTVRVGDGEGRFGPPAWVTVRIISPEKPK